MTGNIQQRLEQQRFLTTAGTETFLIFHQGFELPHFCAFVLHENEKAWDAYQRDFLFPTYQSAATHGWGLLVDALVWRAHEDYLKKLGRHPDQMAAINHRAIEQTRASLASWHQQNPQPELNALVTADIGPRGDGYQVATEAITVEQARQYHQPQIDALSAAKADLVCALTMTTATESIGIVNAANANRMPTIVSATVETDGRLPDGKSLAEFIDTVDQSTATPPLYYMVNCAHPSHLYPTMETARQENQSWLSRLRGFRANASAKSHAELDESEQLDRGDVSELASQIKQMDQNFDLRVIGGCCGTDHEHLDAIASCIPASS